MKKLAILISLLLYFSNCNKDRIDLICIDQEIEAFKVKPEAIAILKYDYLGAPIFIFLEGISGRDRVLDINCEEVCLNLCFYCALAGECKGKDFHSTAKNRVEIWRR